MASGIACIGSDFAPISTYIRKYEVEICCNPSSPSDIEKSIWDLISNPGKRIKYGKNGRKIVESELNWESQKEKLLLQYKRLLVS
jgi:glycosyltransferase involved in cell wall biosynthesis